MMRKLFSIVVLLLFSGIFYSQNTEDLIGVPELTFNESKYVLASAQQKSKVQFVQEYIFLRLELSTRRKMNSTKALKTLNIPI